MNVPKHKLDPALAARLSARVKTLLEQRVPFGEGYENNLGILVGLQFAWMLVDATPGVAEQVRETVAEAVKLTAARLDNQLEQRQPELAHQWKEARLTHEMIAQCETHDPDDPTDIPFDDFMRELEEKYGLPPETETAS